MTFKEFILGRDTETEEEKRHKMEMHQRAEQIAMEKRASVALQAAQP